jgi:hypothetical protein
MLGVRGPARPSETSRWSPAAQRALGHRVGARAGRVLRDDPWTARRLLLFPLQVVKITRPLSRDIILL